MEIRIFSKFYLAIIIIIIIAKGKEFFELILIKKIRMRYFMISAGQIDNQFNIFYKMNILRK